MLRVSHGVLALLCLDAVLRKKAAVSNLQCLQSTHVQADWTELSYELWSSVFSKVKAMLDDDQCSLACNDDEYYQEELLNFYNIQRYLHPDTLWSLMSLNHSRTVAMAQCMPKFQIHLCSQPQLLLHLACT